MLLCSYVEQMFRIKITSFGGVFFILKIITPLKKNPEKWNRIQNFYC